MVPLQARRFFWNHRAAPQELARLDRHHIYIVPTGFGLLYAAALFLMLLGSLNYNNNLGIFFTFLFAAVALVSLFHTWLNLLGLEASITGVEPVFAGESAQFRLLIHNPQPRGRYSLQLQGEFVPLSPQATLPHGPTLITLHRSLPRRGRHDFGRLTLSTTYPLGLARAWSHAELLGTAIAYPHPSTLQELPQQENYARSSEGDLGEGTDDFVGLRHYRRGDSLHHVHWRAIAKGQPLITRQFGGDRALQTVLDWTSTPGRDTEERLSHLCRCILLAEAAGVEYRLALPGLEIPLGRGPAQRARCLYQLAIFDAR